MGHQYNHSDTKDLKLVFFLNIFSAIIEIIEG